MGMSERAECSFECQCLYWDGVGVTGRGHCCQNGDDLNALGDSSSTEKLARHFSEQMSHHHSQLCYLLAACQSPRRWICPPKAGRKSRLTAWMLRLHVIVTTKLGSARAMEVWNREQFSLINLLCRLIIIVVITFILTSDGLSCLVAWTGIISALVEESYTKKWVVYSSVFN